MWKKQYFLIINPCNYGPIVITANLGHSPHEYDESQPNGINPPNPQRITWILCPSTCYISTTLMEIVKPPCRSIHCPICYGSISNTLPQRLSAFYRIRLGNNRHFHPYRLSKQHQEQSSSLPKGPSLFLQLPLEIRLLIYKSCQRRPPEMETQRRICHWVEGGAWHRDDPRNWGRSPFTLDVYGIVPSNLLRVNKQIHREATKEVYRLTAAHLLYLTPNCFPILDYWLHEHPLRYTRFLTIGRFGYSNDDMLKVDDPSITDMGSFVKIFNAMPNLEDLLVNIEGWSQFPNTPYLHLPTHWIPNLLKMCDALHGNITVRLRFEANYFVCGNQSLASTRCRNTVTKLAELLQKEGFSLITISPSWNVSHIQLPFEMARFCGNASTQASSNDRALMAAARTKATLIGFGPFGWTPVSHLRTEYRRYF